MLELIDQLLRFSSTKADWLRLMRVSVRRISLWALLTYAVLAVFGQPLHQWTYHARPLAVVAPGGSCCPCAPPGPGGAATDTSATSQSNDDSPARQHPPHDSQHCVVCQFSIKAQALPEVFDCPVWQSLIERLTLPEPPVLAPEFHAAFFSRGPPPA